MQDTINSCGILVLGFRCSHRVQLRPPHPPGP